MVLLFLEYSIRISNQSLSSSIIIRQIGGILVSILVALLIVSDPYKEVYTFQKYSNREQNLFWIVQLRLLQEQIGNMLHNGLSTQRAYFICLSVFLRLAKFFIKRLKIQILGLYAIYPINALFRFDYLDLAFGALLKKPDKISLFFDNFSFNFNYRFCSIFHYYINHF